MSKELLDEVRKIIDAYSDDLRIISSEIWSKPEIGLEEKFAHDYLTNFLEKEGFKVTRAYKIPTAFKAEFCPNPTKRPTVAILCEYDALPGIGHGCGHNLIAECGVGAGLAIKNYLEKDSSSTVGNIVVIGTPAEENFGGKKILIEKGAFEGKDMALMAHPAPGNFAHPLKYLSSSVKTVTFFGKSAHAANYPWIGLNALDAVVQCYNNISHLRQQMEPSWRVHMNITEGGTALNCIPDRAQLKVHLRAIPYKELKELEERVLDCINSASISTRCKVEILDGVVLKNVLSNYEMAATYRKYAEMCGEKFLDDDPDQKLVTFGSTDMGDVTYIMPGIHPKFFIGSEVQCHTKKFTEAAKNESAQEHVLISASALACTALEVMQNEEKFLKIINEYKRTIQKYQI